jgi:protein-tyrosine phosphatase
VTFQIMEEARRLADFLEEHAPHAHTVVVQCQAGISRSPAIAAAIALFYPCHTTCQVILKRYPAFHAEQFRAIVDEWRSSAPAHILSQATVTYE